MDVRLVFIIMWALALLLVVDQSIIKHAIRRYLNRKNDRKGEKKELELEKVRILTEMEVRYENKDDANAKLDYGKDRRSC